MNACLMDPKPQNPKGARPHNEKNKEKLAAKLRENLKRRKQQVRTRGLDPASGSRGAFNALGQDSENADK